jgi:hypothetical protein
MENLEMPKGKRKINKIYIHHSASPRATTTREDIYKWHVVQNGWKDIGYHYMINNLDMVEIGRTENTTGAHVKTITLILLESVCLETMRQKFQLQNKSKYSKIW